MIPPLDEWRERFWPAWAVLCRALLMAFAFLDRAMDRDELRWMRGIPRAL